MISDVNFFARLATRAMPEFAFFYLEYSVFGPNRNSLTYIRQMCHCQMIFYLAEIKSCIEIYKNGTRTNGHYFILGADDVELEVYCDFESEANSSWTLVVSYSLKNRALFRVPYFTNKPRNSTHPNWSDYR